MCFQAASLDFGLVQRGTQPCLEVSLRNPSQHAAAVWSLQELPQPQPWQQQGLAADAVSVDIEGLPGQEPGLAADSAAQEPAGQLSGSAQGQEPDFSASPRAAGTRLVLHPEVGTLQPGESCTVQVRFRPCQGPLMSGDPARKRQQIAAR